MYCDCDNKKGELQFYNRNGMDHAVFDTYSENNMWYHNTTRSSRIPSPSYTSNLNYPSIKRLNRAALHELWHQRLLHPGTKCMCSIHKHVDGIDEPLNGNCFYRCAACMQGKPRKQPRGPSSSTLHRRKRTKKKTHRIPKDQSPWDHLDLIDDI